LIALGASHEIIYSSTLTRMDALAIGALAAILLRQPDRVARWAPRLPAATLLAAAALVATALGSGLLARQNPVSLTVGDLVIAPAAAAFTLLLVVETGARGRLARLMSAPLLRRFGRYSYAIYIFQLPLQVWVTRRLVRDRLEEVGDGAFLLWQAGYFVVMIA